MQYAQPLVADTATAMISLVSRSSLPGFITVFRCRQTDSSCSGLFARARQKLLIRSTFLVALMSANTALTIGWLEFSSTSLTVGMLHLSETNPVTSLRL